MSAQPVLVPLVDANEHEATVTDVFVRNGQRVECGVALVALETTKTVEDVEAPHDGYVVGLTAARGDRVVAGDVLLHLADDPDWSAPIEVDVDSADDPGPGGLRITAPARERAERLGVPLDAIPRDVLVTAQVVEDVAASRSSAQERPPDADASRVVIYGAGGHGRTLAALLDATGTYQIMGYVDDGKPTHTADLRLLGASDALARLRRDGIGSAVNGIGGISRVGGRIEATQRLTIAGFALPALVHPAAVVEPSAVLSDASQVLAFAYVGTHTRVGRGCLINTGAIVSHDCVLGDHVICSPGAVIAGGVSVGDGSLLGMGVTVNLGVTIGAGVRIGNGTTVVTDVPDGTTVHAGTRWPDR